MPWVSNVALAHDRKPCSPLPKKKMQKTKPKDCFTPPLRSLMRGAASLLLLFQCMQGRKNMSSAVFVIQITAVYVPLKMLIVTEIIITDINSTPFIGIILPGLDKIR